VLDVGVVMLFFVKRAKEGCDQKANSRSTNLSREQSIDVFCIYLDDDEQLYFLTNSNNCIFKTN
jgi:hypothetical protein